MTTPLAPTVVKVQVLRSEQDRVGDPAKDFPKAVKAALLELLLRTSRPQPVALPSGEAKAPVTVWLNADEHTNAADCARTDGYESVGVYLSALLHASLMSPDDAPDLTIDRLTAALGLPSRVAQRQFSAQIATRLQHAEPHSVLLAEAATGIGKSLGFLAVAVESLARMPARPIVIAAPAYSVLQQSFAEWKRLSQQLPDLPEAVLVMGQQEYVSELALRALLDHEHETPVIADWVDPARAWLDAGAPPPPDGLLTQAWTQAGLRAACPAFPHSETVRLTSDTTEMDAGKAAYRGQFLTAEQERAHVVFCTHAMLAVEVKLRRQRDQRRYKAAQHVSAAHDAWNEVSADWAAWKANNPKGKKRAKSNPETADSTAQPLPVRAYILQNDLLANLDDDADPMAQARLPNDALVIVDEAHLLEEAFARTFASGESVWRLVGAAKTLIDSPAMAQDKRKKLKAALPALLKARDNLRALGAEQQGDTVVLTRANDQQTADAPYLAALQSLFNALEPFLAPLKRDAKDSDARVASARIRRAQYDLKTGLRGDAATLGVGMVLSWSPNLSWPSFECGRMDVSGALDYLWSNVADRSICVSATLYTETGIDPSEAIQRMLGIRPKRAVVLDTIRPAWVTQPVEVRTPPPPDARPYPEWLTYPTRDSDGIYAPVALRRWIEDVGEYVAEVAIHNEATHRGGILLLLTSHADRLAIGEWLVGRLGSHSVVSQVQGRPLELTKTEFIERRASGICPIFIGVGAAWTGLDLCDREAPPERDLLLTDVIIPRLPIGTNRTLTHLARKRRLGAIAAEMLAASVTLRQGVGRLIRRMGVQGRVLHVLDGRAANPGFSFGRVMERVLGIYPNRTYAKPPGR